jgi:hypothetical protein
LRKQSASSPKAGPVIGKSKYHGVAHEAAPLFVFVSCVMLDSSYRQRGLLAERRDDLHETPCCAVEALRRVERLPHRIWEPACGPGSIVNVLRAAGHEVIGSDLVDYGDPTHFYRRDFLMEPLPKGCEAIVTNPPFKLAAPFIRHALDIGAPFIAMLLRFAFYESQSRADIFDSERRVARIHVFAKRLPRMHRTGWAGPRAPYNHTHAWFVWSAEHKGPTTIDRISWDDS